MHAQMLFLYSCMHCSHLVITVSASLLSCVKNEQDASELRGSVCSVLKRCKLPPPNITKEERVALSNLRKKDNIVFLPADKGNATVVMDCSEYEGKVRTLLGDPVYKKVKSDPTPATERRVLKEVRQLERESLIPSDLGRRLKPNASRPPKLYGFPKIHKPDVPLRPIVSSIGSPTYGLSRHMTDLITPLAGRTSSYVRNSKHFVEMLQGVRLQPEEVMVSFDVKSLFTNVPISEALEITLQGL